MRHIPCTACGSSDANSLYTDGHEWCHRCSAYKPGDKSTAASPSAQTHKRMALDLVAPGEAKGLRSRQITDATCEHFGYTTTKHAGKPCQVAPYYDADGRLVAQKLRYPDKTFKVTGSLDEALPFGAHCWQKTGKMIVVTEGEIDALSMSQVQGNKWPVVSIGCGAGGQIKRYIARHLDYFNGFEKVVLMFDNDEPGRTAAKDAAEIIGRHAHIAELPLKDANEMLVAGRTEELIQAMWRAQQYRPEGIVDMASLRDRVKEPPRWGLSFPWPRLTQLTYGIPERAVIAVGGAGGGGKTDVLTQIIQHLVSVHHEAVGVFSLEQSVVETATRVAGKFAGKTFHVPDSGWTDSDKDAAWASLMTGGKVFLYDSFGVNEWDVVKSKIEFLRHSEGVRYFFIDNMTALVASEDNEKEGIERILADMGSLVQALDVTLFVISHLSTPEGKPHEEGGRVMGKHFKGSRSWIFWSYLMLGLERNQQAEDVAERSTTVVRVLKERKTGRGMGETTTLFYHRDTGLLEEIEPGASPAHGFKDETVPETADF